jgi:uroporphyrinogen decarboxylase
MNDLWKPNKQRLFATLNGEIPDRVPTFEVLIEARNVNAILGRDVGSTMAASRGASDADVYLAPPMDPKDYIEVNNYTGQDSLVLESLWAPFKIEDEDGKLHSIEHGYAKSWEDLDKIILPDWNLDILPRKQYLEEYVKAAKETDMAVTYMTGAFYQYCYQFLVGFQDFCALIYEDRELLEKIMDLTLDYYIKITEVAINAGVDILFFADDVAYKTGTFVHPAMFKELWFPRMKKLINMAREAGLPVLFHSCGNLNSILDSVICELDIDCLYPIEPYSMDIYKIKPQYENKFCIAGNLDIAGPLALGTPEQAYEAAKRLITALKPNGRYIFASSHSITDDIPPENYAAALQALRNYGIY